MGFDLEFYLSSLHNGQWFGFSDIHKKIYSNLVIYSDDIKPTEQECINGITKLQDEYNAKEYARLRVTEYPQVEDYLDGIVKGDQDQIDKYIADCLAVKAKYPKGE